MELTLIAAVGVISIVAVAAFSERIGVAAPLLLVIVGIGLSFVPRLPPIEPNPKWILSGVLPPLLYAAAVRMPALDFRRNLTPIVGLAVLLVGATTLASGYLFDALLPALPIAGCLALGAVISPTDAVAATAVGKRLGLPSRLLAILEGEGLVNDATSLVLLGSAVAATVGEVHPTHVALRFAESVVFAIVVGWLVGEISIRIRALLRDPVLDTAISFTIPFLAFVPAEELHASGVLAVVVCGLVTGNRSARYLDPQTRLSESINWATVAFLLENAIFLLLGLQLKTLLDHESAAGLSAGRALLIGVLASVLVVVIRIAFVAPIVSFIRHEAGRAHRRIPMIDAMAERVRMREFGGRFRGHVRERVEHRATRLRADAEFRINEAFGWRGGFVLAWAGMRGAVTVAAAQSLPNTLPDRPQLLLIAFVVACTTLLVQGLTLPTVIRVVKVPGDDEAEDRREYASLLTELMESADDVLEQARPSVPAPVLERAREDLRVRVEPPGGTEALESDPREQYREVMLDALRAEREQLLAVRSAGSYSSRALSRAERSLDLEQLRLERISYLAPEDAEVEPEA